MRATHTLRRDTYVYPAPFNLVELFLLPFEKMVDHKTYAKMNRYVMSVIFFVPLCVPLLLNELKG